MRTTKTIGIIPIKGHSERVPGKNFRLLGNVPLWHYPVRALSESGVVDEIIIDTDAPDEFLGVIPDCSCPVLLRDRPEDVCGDEVSMNLVLESVVRQYEADRYVQVHATNPFLSPATLATVIRHLDDEPIALYSVTEHYSRFWRRGRPPVPVNHKLSNLIPTQNLDPLLEENSSFYMFERGPFLAFKTRTPVGAVPVVIPKIEGIDIDTEEDWQFARMVMAGALSGV